MELLRSCSHVVDRHPARHSQVLGTACCFLQKSFEKLLTVLCPAEGVLPYDAMPGPPLWPVLGNMPQTLPFLRQEAHAHHVLWTTFAEKYGGIYRWVRLLGRPCASLCRTACTTDSHYGPYAQPYCLCPPPSRLHIPGSRFVVVSDPDILPAIIGRPGLPKWAAYENVVPVRSPAALGCNCPMPQWSAMKGSVDCSW